MQPRNTAHTNKSALRQYSCITTREEFPAQEGCSSTSALLLSLILQPSIVMFMEAWVVVAGSGVGGVRALLPNRAAVFCRSIPAAAQWERPGLAPRRTGASGDGSGVGQVAVAEAMAPASAVEEMLAPHDTITIAWPPERWPAFSPAARASAAAPSIS
jgi:hypothetical protein